MPTKKPPYTPKPPTEKQLAARATSRNAKDMKRGYCYVPYFFPEHLPHSYHHLDTGIIPAHIEAHFWGLVERGEPDECWEWLGNIKHSADIRPCGEVVAWGRRISAHEFSSLLHKGLTPGFTARQCDHLPLCVNPKHLALDPVGTPRPRATKTHCANGHPRTPYNTFVSRTGMRYCRVCKETPIYGDIL